MVSEERLPRLRRRATTPGHVLRHGRLGHLDSQLEQLAMDPGRPPQRIGQADLANQVSDFSGNSWSTRAASGLPAPERLEAAPMPANNGFRLDDDDRIQHARPQPIEPDEEEPVGPMKPKPLPRGTAHEAVSMQIGLNRAGAIPSLRRCATPSAISTAHPR